MAVDDAAIDLAAPSDDRPPGPYIGLKPYEAKDRFLFFGRDADARRLIDKIFSSQLTLFYGPSGVGKSSLLLARVTPELRDPKTGDAVVVTFDEWGEQDVETAIKREISREIGPDAVGVGTQEPLTVWAGLVNRVRRKPLILILDQFEQFLIARTGRPDPLRSELAALVYADLDVHVVLSLREEFLAGLEVFAREIVSIYDSKFRLEHLTDKGAEEAIIRPPREFGVSVEQPLVDTLIAELKKQDEAALTATTAPGVELPFLQIVCKELWDSPERGENGSLSLDLYTRLGTTLDNLSPRDRIIQRYVERLAGALPPPAQEDAAQILNLLAPRNRVKQSYDASLLSDLTHLPIECAEGVLEHFAKSYVLRERLIAGSRSFELYHDAYIGVLRPWIDKRLNEKKEREEREDREKKERAERQKRWVRRWKWGTAITLAISIVSLIVTFEVRNFQKQHWIEIGEIDQAIAKLHVTQNKAERLQQRRMLDYAFVQSAAATLQKVENETDMRIIIGHLSKLAERFTDPSREDYIYETPCMEAWAADVLPEPGEHPVITLSFNPERDFDDDGLRCAWAEMATLLRKSALPVILPRRIAIKPDGNLSRDIIEFNFGGTSFSVPFPSRRHGAVVASSDLADHSQLIRFFEREHETVQLLDIREGKLGVHNESPDQIEAWVLPHWAFPLLRAAKIDPKPEGIAIVDAAIETLFRDPRPALTQQVVDYLVKHTTADPSTVAEAERARGGTNGIRRVLLKMVARRDKSGAGDQLNFVFRHFAQIVDALGRYPRDAPTPAKQGAGNANQGFAQNDPTSPPPSARKESYTDDEAADAVWSELRSLGIVAPSDLKLRGVVLSQTAAASASAANDKPAAARGGDFLADYELSPAEVPAEDRVVRVLLGDRLFPCLVENADTLRPGFVQAMRELRDKFRRSIGVNVPGVLLIDAKDLASNELIMEFEGQRIAGISDPVAVQGDCVKETVSAMEIRLQLARAMWLSTEDVDHALSALGPSQTAWLRSNYNLTDLKLLLRAVLSPEKAEIDSVRPPTAHDGRTVQGLPDLLLSLTFWTKACVEEGGAGVDTACVVRGLRETERARFSSAATLSQAIDRVSQPLGAGIDSLAGLSTDSVASAEVAFAAAVKDAPSEAMQAFPHLFASRILVSQALRLERNCPLRPGSVLSRLYLSDEVRAEIDVFFDAAEAAISDAVWQHLRICRLRGYDLETDGERAASDLERLLAYAPRPDWTADDAVAAATLALKFEQQGRSAITHLQQAPFLYARAFKEWGSTDDVDKPEATFSEGIGVCEESSGPRWCWSVLEAGLGGIRQGKRAHGRVSGLGPSQQR